MFLLGYSSLATSLSCIALLWIRLPNSAAAELTASRFDFDPDNLLKL